MYTSVAVFTSNKVNVYSDRKRLVRGCLRFEAVFSISDELADFIPNISYLVEFDKSAGASGEERLWSFACPRGHLQSSNRKEIQFGETAIR